MNCAECRHHRIIPWPVGRSALLCRYGTDGEGVVMDIVPMGREACLVRDGVCRKDGRYGFNAAAL